MEGLDLCNAKSLLKGCLDSGIQDVDCDTLLFKYLSNLETNTVEYKGKFYTINLRYYQDIPEYEIIELGMNNRLVL